MHEGLGASAFAVAEKLKSGALLTEFNEYGEVVDQGMVKGIEPLAVLMAHFCDERLEVSKASYKAVEAKIFCKTCGKESTAVRELDTHAVTDMSAVPVVPIFKCKVCNTRYYSMTDEYLDRLVERNIALFDGEEAELMKKDAEAFRKELKEYIIRIFASKRIFRLEIKK
jgi:hypothetical protein